MACLRVLHLADTHLGFALGRRPATDRVRGGDFLDAFRSALRPAAEEPVDLVLVAGDLFDGPSPPEVALAAVIDGFSPLLASGTPIVIVPGHADGPLAEHSLWFAQPAVHVLDAPRTVCLTLRDRKIAVAGFSHTRPNARDRVGAAIEATGWRDVAADFRILLMHQRFEDPSWPPATARAMQQGDQVVPRDAIPNGFDYIAAGGIHRHTVIPRQTGNAGHAGTSLRGAAAPIVYPGATERRGFGAADEPRGVVIATLYDDRRSPEIDFRPHALPPMCSTPVDVSGRTRAAVHDATIAAASALPAGARWSLRLSGRWGHEGGPTAGLAAALRAARPDLWFEIDSRSVVASPRTGRIGKVAHAPTAGEAPALADVLSAITAPPAEIVTHAIVEVGALPTSTGVYAFADVAGRLLYIGKALRLRARVRGHLRGGAAGFFAGWTREIASVAVRPAESELEALLVEAELIRRWQPPFNQRARLWTRYGYIVADDRGGPLRVAAEPEPGHCAYGPFRGWAGIRRTCAAIDWLFGPSAASDLAPGREARAAFLAGRDDAALARRCASPDAAAHGDTLERLALSFAQARRLAQAAALVGGWLVLPAATGVKVAALGSFGVRIAALPGDRVATEANARELLSWSHAAAPTSGCVPKACVDAAILLRQWLRRNPRGAVFLPREDVLATPVPALAEWLSQSAVASLPGASVAEGVATPG